MITLRATPAEVGFLVAADTAAWLVLALPAGAFIDRAHRRPVLVASNVVAALLIAWIPIAWATGVLAMWQLYAVALLAGCAAVVTNLASTAYLPSLVPAAMLPDANGAVQTSMSLAAVAGPSAGGALVQAVGAPVAVVADALSFLVCAVSVGLIRHREPPAPQRPRRRVVVDVRAGLRHTFRAPVLRAIALTGGLANMALNAWNAVVVLFLVRELGLSPAVIGVLSAALGAGGVAGAAAAPRLIRQLGIRVALWAPLTLGGALALLMPMTGSGPRLSLFVVGGAVSTAGGLVYNVAAGTYVQQVTPSGLLGRTMASIRTVSRGSLAFGGLAGGALATCLPLRAAMWCVCGALVLSSAPIVLVSTQRATDAM